MALVLADRVLETTAVAGTGTATLLGAQAGYQSFSSKLANGDTTYYTIVDNTAGTWEVGTGTYSAGTLARTTVLDSSNGGALVPFGSGTKDIFIDLPAEKVGAVSGVATVTGTAPVVSSGGANPAISMAKATTSVNGYLAATDFTTFNSKAPATSGTSILYGNGSGGFSNVTIGTNLTFSAGTLNATGGSMVYPGAGIPNSTGSAWGTSYTTSGTGTTVALTTSPTFVTPALGTPSSGTLTNCTGLPVGGISATGTPSSTTYLRGDGTWSAAGGGSGSPAGSTGQIQFNTSGAFDASANLFWDNTNARLGIGTSSPALKLDISGGTSPIVRITSGTSGSAFYITKNSTSDTFMAMGDAAAITGGAVDTLAQIYTNAGIPLSFAISNTEKMRIDSAGNVGIGTSSPSFALQLNTASSIDIETGATNPAGTTRFGTRGSGNGYLGSFTSGKSLEFWSGANLNATLDSSGNLGLGVTPSAWTAYTALQLPGGAISGTSSSNRFEVLQNAYYNSGNYYYTATFASSMYRQTNGIHNWFNAPSGTAGNPITFTQAMTLFASGGLSIGNTTDPGATNLSVTGTTTSTGGIVSTSIGATGPSTGAFTYISTSSSTSTTPTLSFNASNSPYAAGATISGSYLQHMLQNKSATAGASTNYVLSNDSGTDSTFYGEFGMNSSVFSASTPADFFSINNGVYLSGHDGDITVGSGNGFKTYLAWGTTGQSAHVINASGAIGLNTNLGTTPATSGTTNFGTSGQVLTSGGSAATPTWTTPTTGTVTSVAGTGTVNGLTLTGTVTTTGSLTLGGTLDLSSPPAIGGTTASTGRFTTITSTIATGTAPFTVTSTTNVANLNASSLNGATFAAPGAIGSTTAGTGAFTTLSASSTVSGTGFSTYLASPPAIGGTAAAAGSFTSLTATSVGTAGVLAKTARTAGSVLAVAGSLTLTTAGTTLASQAAATGAVWRVRAYGTYAAVSSANARTFTMACFWGTTQLTAITAPAAVLASTANTTNWNVEFEIITTSTTAAWVTGVLNQNTGVATGAALLTTNATPASTTGLTTTSTLDLRVGQTGTATATDNINVHSVIIERIV